MPFTLHYKSNGYFCLLSCIVSPAIYVRLGETFKNYMFFQKPISVKFNLPLSSSEESNFKNETTCTDNTFHIITMPSLIKFHPAVPQKPVCKGVYFLCKNVNFSRFNLPRSGSEGTKLKKETTCIDNTFHTIILPSLIKFHPLVLEKPSCKVCQLTERLTD